MPSKESTVYRLDTTTHLSFHKQTKTNFTISLGNITPTNSVQDPEKMNVCHPSEKYSLKNDCSLFSPRSIPVCSTHLTISRALVWSGTGRKQSDRAHGGISLGNYKSKYCSQHLSVLRLLARHHWLTLPRKRNVTRSAVKRNQWRNTLEKLSILTHYIR